MQGPAGASKKDAHTWEAGGIIMNNKSNNYKKYNNKSKFVSHKELNKLVKDGVEMHFEEEQSWPQMQRRWWMLIAMNSMAEFNLTDNDDVSKMEEWDVGRFNGLDACLMELNVSKSIKLLP